MRKITKRKDFIERVARRARFTQGDVEDILEAMITELEDEVRNDDGNYDKNPKILLKVRRFGKLSVALLPSRGGNGGVRLPETTRVFFTLASNIRDAGKRSDGRTFEDTGDCETDF